MFSFMFISNFIYFISTKEKLGFKKSILYNYFSYFSIVVTTVYMIILNEHRELDYGKEFYITFFFIIGLGLIFSLIASTIKLLGFTILLKIKKSNI